MRIDTIRRAAAIFRGTVQRSPSPPLPPRPPAGSLGGRFGGDVVGTDLLRSQASRAFLDEVRRQASGRGVAGGGAIPPDGEGRRRRDDRRPPPIPPEFERALRDWRPTLGPLLDGKDDDDEMTLFDAAIAFLADYATYLPLWFPEFAPILVPLCLIARAYRSATEADKIEMLQVLNEVFGQKFGVPLALLDVGVKLSQFLDRQKGAADVYASVASAAAVALPRSKRAAALAMTATAVKSSGITGSAPSSPSATTDVRTAGGSEL